MVKMENLIAEDGIVRNLIRDYPYISTEYILRTTEEIRRGGERPGPLEAEILRKNQEYRLALEYCQNYVNAIKTILDGNFPDKRSIIERTRDNHRGNLIVSSEIWRIIITEPEKYKLQQLRSAREKAGIINQMYDALPMGRTTRASATTHEFETDLLKANVSEDVVLGIDSINFEHIHNYFYKCVNNHGFNIESILSYCKSGIQDGRNCSSCPTCREPMDKKLYKQAKQITDLQGPLLDKTLEVEPDLEDTGLALNSDYDPERIRLVTEMVKMIAYLSNETIENELVYYAKGINKK